MSVCDLYSGLGNLSQAFTHLKESWTEAKLHWRDAAAADFEKQHLTPIPGRLQSLIRAVEQLAIVVQRAELECRDEGEGGRL